MKRKTCYLVIDGTKKLDCLEYALAFNMMLPEAKELLWNMYAPYGHKLEFVVGGVK